ncbi:MAG: hypothetical protein JWO32_2542 [Bacteroidetes bacterium]|nr:hypothetical protein [Bacteroidota bacterium]
MTTDSKLHGSIFLLLQRFVNSNYGEGTWEKLLTLAGHSGKEFNTHANYPLTEMNAIIVQASKLTGIAESDLKEKFGEKMVPDLMHMYKKYMQPEWKTFEVLAYTELVMHKAVRKEEHNAHPPILNVSRVHDKLLIIDYHSERKMGSLAVGIIKGIAAYFNEQDQIQVIPLSNPNDERVQIRVEFK